jgi:hypothetical protein
MFHSKAPTFRGIAPCEWRERKETIHSYNENIHKM